MSHIYRLVSIFLCLLLLSCPLKAQQLSQEIGLINGVDRPYPAPLMMGITTWINSDPIKLSDMKEKVILIEFWTSTCPYCKRALPIVNEWYKRYHNRGLMIIGIHSPKTEEEHSLDTVKEAVKNFNIQYPVALDNYFETWDNYDVNSWPAFYLIDKKGQVVFVNVGADNFEIIENNIIYLLNSK